ncbi:Guanylate kinase [Salix suchowensis]|nr:Guanylate kinase [Salix suchowensis]
MSKELDSLTILVESIRSQLPSLTPILDSNFPSMRLAAVTHALVDATVIKLNAPFSQQDQVALQRCISASQHIINSADNPLLLQLGVINPIMAVVWPMACNVIMHEIVRLQVNRAVWTQGHPSDEELQRHSEVESASKSWCFYCTIRFHGHALSLFEFEAAECTRQSGASFIQFAHHDTEQYVSRIPNPAITHFLPGSSSTEPRSSLDSETNTSPPSTTKIAPSINGHTDGDSQTQVQIQALKELLQRTTEEKETLATQYNNLLAKLTAMRTTLGNKLKQDAEELDRREQLLQQLTAQNEDLTSTVETLKEELVSSNHEAERAHLELDHVRSRTLLESTQESMLRERELREAQTELERCRMERDEWERTAQQERLAQRSLERMKGTWNTNGIIQRGSMLNWRLRKRNPQICSLSCRISRPVGFNLQVRPFILFLLSQGPRTPPSCQGARSATHADDASTGRVQEQSAECRASIRETQSSSSRVHDLEKEVKEKNLLIGKLRHEAVIINEHLMEALRRLRRNSSEVNVDRRLVSNVLLSFLTTPRGDAKRFEMLGLLATVLSWSDAERRKRAYNGPTLLLVGRGCYGVDHQLPHPKPSLRKAIRQSTLISRRLTVVLPPMGRIPTHGIIFRCR